MNKFAENLGWLMKGTEISQGTLAKLLNVKQQTISRYANGEREPGIDTLIEIAKIFDVTVGQLLGTEEY